jgi:F1F0 ATPase subunit 2
MVSRILEYSWVLAAGMLTGAFYFGGLWWTVRRVIRSRSPGFLLAASFLVRSAIALAAFYVVMDKNWLRLVVCLAGFLIIRQALTWVLGPGGNALQPRRKESLLDEDHA